jgi:hypothetical protein
LPTSETRNAIVTTLIEIAVTKTGSGQIVVTKMTEMIDGMATTVAMERSENIVTGDQQRLPVTKSLASGTSSATATAIRSVA